MGEKLYAEKSVIWFTNLNGIFPRIIFFLKATTEIYRVLL